MKTLKLKLISLVAMVCLVLGLVVVGIYAAEIQYINLGGNITFNVDDKSLYVQDVRIQEDMQSNPYSLKQQGDFIPGYINGEFNMNLGSFTNDYGGIMVYFDIINTVDDEGNSSLYRVAASTTQTGIDVSVFVDTDNNLIPRGTISPSDIRSDTEATATVVLTVSSPSGAKVELDKITVVITREPEIYSNYSFATNEDGTATLTSYTGDETNVVIPETISVRTVDGQTQYIQGEEYRVTSIADASSYTQGAFYNVRTKIESVLFPETLTHIGDYAFYNCRDISTLDLPDSLESIGIHAFHGCKALTSLEFPANVTSIGREVFSNSGVQTVTFAEGSKLTEIGEYVFQDGHSINSVLLPESVTAIGAYAFRDCQSLTEITIPAGVQTIGEYAFRDSGVQTVTFAENSIITEIGINAFQDAHSLKNITLPESVTTIGDSAFRDCQSLTSFHVPANVTSIGEYAFQDSDVQTVTFAENSKLTALGDYAFANANSLTRIELPEGLQTIGEYTFLDCAMPSLTIPASVIDIDSNAFVNCAALVEVYNYSDLDTNDMRIGDNSSTSLGENSKIIYNAIELSQLAEKPASKVQEIGNVFYYVDGEDYIALTISSSIQPLDIVLDYQTTEIHMNAFSGSKLQSIDMSLCNNLTYIGDSAFSECDGITTLTIPDSVTSFDGTFIGGSTITMLVFPENSNWHARCGSGYHNESFTYSELADPVAAVNIVSRSERYWSRTN